MTEVTPNTLEELKTGFAQLGTAWEEFKHKNDERLNEIANKGNADPLLTGQIEKINTFLDEQKTRTDRIEAVLNRPAAADPEQKADKPEMKEYKAKFRDYLRKGAGRDYALDDLEQKALSVQSDPDGGYLVTPDMNGRIVTRVFETSPIRQIASVQTISTDALEGLRDTDEASAGWVAEIGSRTETNTPQLGTWRVPVHEMYANPKATQKLLDDANVDVEAWLAAKIADKFARVENAAFVNGTGVAQPQGFTKYTTAATADASRAWGTLEHIKTGVNGDFAASAPGDILFNLVAAFKPQYLNKDATWVTRRTVLTKVRTFKESTTNAYMWQPGLQQGVPDTLLGFGITMAEDMPALATGSLSLALGNFKEGYQIVDRAGIRVLRDPYTSKPHVQFYCTKRTGGGVLQFEAIKFINFSA